MNNVQTVNTPRVHTPVVHYIVHEVTDNVIGHLASGNSLVLAGNRKISKVVPAMGKMSVCASNGKILKVVLVMENVKGCAGNGKMSKVVMVVGNIKGFAGSGMGKCHSLCRLLNNIIGYVLWLVSKQLFSSSLCRISERAISQLC